MSLSAELAAALRSELQRTGLTQAEFARRSGVSLKHVNQVLQGRAGFSMQTADRWAELLGKQWQVKLSRNHQSSG